MGFLLECWLSYLLACACLVCLLVYFGVVRLFLFSLNAGPALLPGPFVPSDIALSVSWGFPVIFYLVNDI